MRAPSPALLRLLRLLCLSAATGTAAAVHAQAAAPAPAAKVKSLLDDQPVMSARGAGMGGALSTVADDIDAAFANPAGIGGLDWGKKDPPFVRKLFFPWFGVSANQSSQALAKEVRATGATKDSTIGKAVLDANAVLTIGPETFLETEADYQLVRQDGVAGTQPGLFTYNRLFIEPTQGLLPYLLVDTSQETLGIKSSRRESPGLGLQWFPRPHLELDSLVQQVMHPVDYTYATVGRLLLHYYF